MIIRSLTYSDRLHHETLFRQMFRGRARTFAERLGWKVSVERGMERDRYDTLPSVRYLVATDSAETVVGSLRLLPTTGDTMLRNEFAAYFRELTDFADPATWECTRFCTHPHNVEDTGTGSSISIDLLIGLCEFSMSCGIERIVGVYEAPMVRIYRRIGWSPRAIGRSHPQAGGLLVGAWDVSHDALATMKERRGGSPHGPCLPNYTAASEHFSLPSF